MRRAWVPIVGLIIIAVLQNIDIIAAKHRLPGKELQSSYAATAVAAKVLIWVAIGASLYLVPEVSRRGAEGKPTRPVLFRALGIIFVCAIPVLLIFAVAAKPLLKIAFGANRTAASDSLLVLGLAFTILACTYLAIQYMLAPAADMVPGAARPRRGRRADPAAERLAPSRPTSPPSCWGFRRPLRSSRSGSRCGPPANPSAASARPGRGSARLPARREILSNPLRSRSQAPEVRGAAERQVDRRLLVACRGLDVAADQHPLQQLLVLVVPEGALRRVPQQRANGLGPLLRR